MRRIRVIPALLLKEGGLVKTKKFKEPVYVGDPINALRIFNEKEVDELALLDITKDRHQRPMDIQVVQDIVSEAFMPMAFGGGISTLQRIEQLLIAGVEKVILNSSQKESNSFKRQANSSAHNRWWPAWTCARRCLGVMDVMARTAQSDGKPTS